MIDLNHPQLDPQLNRLRRSKDSILNRYVKAPDPDFVQPEPDPADPYLLTNHGFYDGSIVDERNVTRPYTVYVPTTMKTSGSMMLVFLPSRTAARDFITDDWVRILEERETSAYFYEAPEGWDDEDPGMELDGASKMLAEMRSMQLFAANAPSVYALGFGDGAKTSAVFAMTHCAVLAGWAAWGDCRLDPALVRWIGDSPSDCDTHIMKNSAKLPAFIIDGEGGHILVDYFRKACHTADEGLENRFAYVYRQAPKPGEFYLNDPVISEVWYGIPEKIAAAGKTAVIEQMVRFVTGYRRWAGEGNPYLRRAETPASMGFKEYRKEIDGLQRLWYVFEPTVYKQQRFDKYPLVIGIHGFSCSGPFFAENSGWSMIAEERGFFAVFPMAYPFRRTQTEATRRGPFGGNIAYCPVWNSSMEPDPAGPDEVSFFRQMVADLVARYPIDPERIYVSGHSNGSQMTQLLMRKSPELFAGFNPVGGIERSPSGEAVPEPDDVVRPVWYVLGEFDGAGMYLTGYTEAVFKELCRTDRCDFEHRKSYVSGIHHVTVAKNAAGDPLVRFSGLKNYPHSFSPELSLMVWDDFFAKLKRRPDGSVEWLA